MNLNTLQILPIQTQIHEYWRRFHAEQLIVQIHETHVCHESTTAPSTTHRTPVSGHAAKRVVRCLTPMRPPAPGAPAAAFQTSKIKIQSRQSLQASEQCSAT